MIKKKQTSQPFFVGVQISFSLWIFFFWKMIYTDNGLAWKISQDHDNPEMYNTKIDS